MSVRVALCAAAFCVGLFSSQVCLDSVVAREWSDSSGTFRVDADLVGVEGENVLLKKADSQTVTVRLETLSSEDRDFVAAMDGENRLLEFLDSTEKVLADIQSAETTLQATAGWSKEIPALIDRFRDKPMTFSFRVENIQKAKRGYELTVAIIQPGDCDNFSVRGVRGLTINMAEEEALAIRRNSVLTVTGSVRPELAEIKPEPATATMVPDTPDRRRDRCKTRATEWIACLENLIGRPSDIVFRISQATWGIAIADPVDVSTGGVDTVVRVTPIGGREPGRTTWSCRTYGGTIFQIDGTKWQQVGKDGQITIFTEVNRTSEYIELTGFNFGRGRIYADRIDMLSNGEWKWVASGKWVE